MGIDRQALLAEARSRGLNVPDDSGVPAINREALLAEAQKRGLPIPGMAPPAPPPGQAQSPSGMLTNLAQNFNPAMEDVARGVGQSVLDTGKGALQMYGDVLGGQNFGEKEKIEQMTPNLIAGANNPEQAANAQQMADIAPLALAGAGLAMQAPKVPALVMKAYEKLSPTKYSQTVMNTLSGGKNLEANSKGIAEAIRVAGEQTKEKGIQEFKDYFAGVTSKVGDRFAAPGLSKELGMQSGAPVSKFLDRTKGKTPGYLDEDAADTYKQFVSNPTLENAHILQSELGKEIGQLKRVKEGQQGISNEQLSRLNKLSSSRRELIGDIENAAEKAGLPKEMYQGIKDNWLDNVIPFTANKKMRDIALGKVKNPKNLAGMFKNPEDSLLSVVDKLPPQIKNSIMYEVLGKASTKNPKQLLSRFQKMADQGYGSYVTPELQEMMDGLSKKMGNKKKLLYGAGLAGLGGGYKGIKDLLGASERGGSDGGGSDSDSGE